MHSEKLKAALDVALLALLGSQELVDRWWQSANKGFDGRCPCDVPLEEVRDYLVYHLQK